MVRPQTKYTKIILGEKVWYQSPRFTYCKVQHQEAQLVSKFHSIILCHYVVRAFCPLGTLPAKDVGKSSRA